MPPEKPRKESGVLRTSIERRGRVGAALLLCGALLIVPLVLIQGDPEASASPPATTPDHHRHPASSTRLGPRWKLASDTRTTPPTGAAPGGPGGATTPTPTDPGSTAPPPEQSVAAADEVAQRVPAIATATTAPPPTTTAPPTTTTTTAPAAMGTVSYGQVTYYDHPAGTCASPWLPFGTVVEITNPDNGSSVTCVVDDREADTARSIDLATSTFAEIAPLSQGVIDARLSW